MSSIELGMRIFSMQCLIFLKFVYDHFFCSPNHTSSDKSDRRQPTAGNPWGFCVDGAWMGADGMWCDERGSYDADGYFHPYATADVRAAAMRHRAEQVLISQQPQQQPQEQLQHRHDSQEQPYRSIAAAALSPSSAMQSPQHWLPPVFATADEFDPLALRRRALECARAHRRVLTGGEQLNR